MARDPDSWGESEFGADEGLIDAVRREGRFLDPHEERMEILALPKTFGGSELGLEGGARPTVETTPVPRLLPGEREADRG